MSEFLGITMYRKNGTCPWSHVPLTQFFQMMDDNGHLLLGETYQSRRFRRLTADALNTAHIAKKVDELLHGAVESSTGQGLSSVVKLPDRDLQELQIFLNGWATKRYALDGRYIPDDLPDRLGPDKHTITQQQIDNYRLEARFKCRDFVSVSMAEGFGVQTMTVAEVQNSVEHGVLYRLWSHGWVALPPQHMWYQGIEVSHSNSLLVPEKYVTNE